VRKQNNFRKMTFRLELAKNDDKPDMRKVGSKTIPFTGNHVKSTKNSDKFRGLGMESRPVQKSLGR
jgi:hypothetical protein